MTYPATIYSPVTIVDNVDFPQAAHINTPNTQIAAIETELGTDPAGSLTDVKTRLAVSLADDGDLRLTGDTTLTISGGVITATNNLHNVETEGAASTDELETINGYASGGVLVLSLHDAGHIVTLRNVANDAAGAIACIGGRDIVMSSTHDFVLLIYSTATARWRAMYAGKRTAVISTKTTTYAATANDDIVLCDATAGSGMVVTVKKTDSSANAITIDANGSETIDGVTTKSLSSQYNSLTVACSGSAWSVI
jgi:hypothetical protein